MAGESFDLENNSKILSINSPQKRVGGPYMVVYKDLDARWAIVALDWDGEPKLGMRWFWSNAGNPLSRAQPTWFIIPSEITGSILGGLSIDYKIKGEIEDFLRGKISGEELKLRYTNP
jgi:hypothetical protein